MRVTRTVVVAVTLAASAIMTSAPAAADPIAEGVYSLNFPAGQQGSFDPHIVSDAYAWRIAIRSACPPSGCVATATMLDYSPTRTFVFRQSGGRFIASQAQGYACEGKKTAGTETISFTESGGTLSGELVNSAAPCKPYSNSFTAVRTGDVSPDVDVADPNTV